MLRFIFYVTLLARLYTLHDFAMHYGEEIR